MEDHDSIGSNKVHGEASVPGSQDPAACVARDRA